MHYVNPKANLTNTVLILKKHCQWFKGYQKRVNLPCRGPLSPQMISLYVETRYNDVVPDHNWKAQTVGYPAGAKFSP